MAKWHLVLDAHRFHAYLMAERPTERVRIDWENDNTLQVKAYVDKEGEVVMPVGEAPYCIDCIFDKVKRKLQRYHLFSFNCRTAAFLILTEVLGFDERRTYELFKRHGTLCGLDVAHCFTWEEVDHFIRWKQAGNSIF